MMAAPAPDMQQAADDHVDLRTTNCRCAACGEEDPPSLAQTIISVFWIACASCASWFHEVCLKLGEQVQALGHDWCPTCSTRASEDVLGLGDFADHTATKYNNNLKQICERDLLPAVPQDEQATRKRTTGLLPRVRWAAGQSRLLCLLSLQVNSQENSGSPPVLQILTRYIAQSMTKRAKTSVAGVQMHLFALVAPGEQPFLGIHTVPVTIHADL